jgi:hypothetical protein
MHGQLGCQPAAAQTAHQMKAMAMVMVLAAVMGWH